MTRIDLNSKLNPDCAKRCNKVRRQSITENDLCTLVSSVEDALPVRCVGDWAEQKIYLLSQYFGIFAEGMKQKWELNYIEVCSGPGRCINRSNGNELDGTALCILKHKSFKHINKALFFDFNETIVNVLNKRIEQIGKKNAKALIADYNNATELCATIEREINPKSLNLVLIDPTDCSVPFELIKKIKTTLPNVDFIINVATGTDFNRNIPMAFQNDELSKKYDKFLGCDSFFTDITNKDLCKSGDFVKLRKRFRETYQNSLNKVGYTHFDIELVNHYYDILFAAAHPKALEFWNKATEIKYDGQRSLF